MRSDRRSRRAEKRTTLIAGGILLATLVVAVAGLTGTTSSGSRGNGTHAPGTPRVGYHVGGENCDDARPAHEALAASTPWCTLNGALAGVPDDATILIAPGQYPLLAVRGPNAPSGLRFAAADPAHRPMLAGVDLDRVNGYRFSSLLFSGELSMFRVRDAAVRGNGFTGAGLLVKQSQDVAVIGNHFRHLRGLTRGVLLQGGSYRRGVPTNERIQIRRNVIADVDHDAVAIYNGYGNITISDNRIRDVHQPPNFAYHSDGLQLMGGDRATIARNVIQNVTHGIIVKDGSPSSRLVVTRNLVFGVDGAALQLYNAPAALVSSNTFWRALLGVVLTNDTRLPGITSATLRNNVMQNLVRMEHGVVTRASGNVFGRGATVGRPAYRGRPSFVDAARGDYRIRSSRPGSGIRRATVPGAQLRGGR
jgi:hypothetical protein